MRRNTVIIIASIIIGAIAAVMSVGYLRGAQSDITAENEPVEIFVAQSDIPAGTTAEDLISKKMIEIEKVPRRFVAVGAISSVRMIENQVLDADVTQGEQLTAARFSYPSDAGLAVNIPEDQLAISIDVDAVSGVSGLLKPGDNVVVFANFNESGSARTLTLIPKARVLAVGAITTGLEQEQSAEAKPSGGLLSGGASGQYETVTLSLSPKDAAKAVFARKNGTIQLALIPQTAPENDPPKLISYSSVAE